MFWVSKCKRDKFGKLVPLKPLPNIGLRSMSSNHTSDSIKISKGSSLVKRTSSGSDYNTNSNRFCNDYSDGVKFKIEKIPRQLFRPFTLTRYPRKKNIDIDSTSTKKSSRQSSKQKVTPTVPNEDKPEVNVVKVETSHLDYGNYDKAEIMNSSISQLCKIQNEEVKDQMQSFMINDNFEEDHFDVPVLAHKQTSKIQLEYESIDSYHDDDNFDEAYGEYDNNQYRNRALSGCKTELNDVIDLHQSNSFLFGNERETPNFEPFVADKLFAKGFTFTNKNNEKS